MNDSLTHSPTDWQGWVLGDAIASKKKIHSSTHYKARCPKHFHVHLNIQKWGAISWFLRFLWFFGNVEGKLIWSVAGFPFTFFFLFAEVVSKDYKWFKHLPNIETFVKHFTKNSTFIWQLDQQLALVPTFFFCFS